MIKFIKVLFTTLLLIFSVSTANALYSFTDVKNDIVNELDNTVVVLKNYFKKTDEHLKEDKVIVEATKEEAEALKNSSSAKETNPVVLKHGAVNMPNCNINNQELLWDGKAWVCQKPSYGTDCYPTKDEYRYEENGKIVCSKISKGQSINYYWKFRGLGRTCGSDHKKPLVYSCYYKNKNNQEIEVPASYCAGKTKPTPPNMAAVVVREPASGYYWSNGHYLGFGTSDRSYDYSSSKGDVYIRRRSGSSTVARNVKIIGGVKGNDGWVYHIGDLVDWIGGNEDGYSGGDIEYMFKYYRTKGSDPRAC